MEDTESAVVFDDLDCIRVQDAPSQSKLKFSTLQPIQVTKITEEIKANEIDEQQL